MKYSRRFQNPPNMLQRHRTDTLAGPGKIKLDF